MDDSFDEFMMPSLTAGTGGVASLLTAVYRLQIANVILNEHQMRFLTE